MTCIVTQGHEGNPNMGGMALPAPQISAQPSRTSVWAETGKSSQMMIHYLQARLWLLTMVTGITWQPYNSWKILVNPEPPRASRRWQEEVRLKPFCFGYILKFHILHKALSIDGQQQCF